MTAATELTTLGIATFAPCNAQNHRLFRVNSGICIVEALELASLLMTSANELTLLGSTAQPQSMLVWSAHYLGDMAKAIIDDVAAALQNAQDSGQPVSLRPATLPPSGQ